MKLETLLVEFDQAKLGGKKIPREKIIKWMNSDDIEIQGAIYTFCTDVSYYKYIEPNLTAEDYYKFIKPYFERCIRENPRGEWCESRYEAGWALVGWFKNYWSDKSLPRSYVGELKDWLAKIYLAGDDDIKLCISTAILEHLFDNKRISSFFSDWKTEPSLKKAYDEAMGCAGRIKGP